jgi:serine/threonine-protein kinase
VTTDLRALLQTTLGDTYTLERELGGGGMSHVFVAEEARLGRRVVLKVLAPELTEGMSAERFAREVRVAARLQHPNIVPLLTAGERGGLAYYTMPFVEGESLRAHLAQVGRMSLDAAVSVLRDVARALEYAHTHGVVHRDIKPGNILLAGSAATVTDFGVAKAVQAARAVGAAEAATDTLTCDGTPVDTPVGTPVGTPAYMAPEQAAGDPDVDARADVYAWGVVAYELLTGVLPFAGPSVHQLVAAHIREMPLPVGDRAPDLPPALSALVMRCLEKAPSKRPQTGGELLIALESTRTLSGERITDTTRKPQSQVTPTGETARDPGITTAEDSSPSALAIAAPSAPGRAADTAGARLASWPWMRRGVLLPVLSIAALAMAIAVGAGLIAQSDHGDAMDSTLVAVAPFDVLDPASMLWHEGMVDVLSRALDGAGPLHTVSPTTSIRAWKGRAADGEAAAALGRATGARSVVVGSILQAGPDSIRVTAALVDARTGDRVAEVVRRDAATRMDRLTDSLAVALIRALGGVEPVAAVRRAGMTGGGNSLDALKAFLHGEQAFRRAHWEDARTAYEQAVALDSASPLALRRLGMVASWERLLQDSLAASYLLRAGARNTGLGPRDSLLVAADSLAAAANITTSALTAWSLTRRLFSTLDASVQRYPKDPEVWFALGEARYHFGFGPVVGVPERATLAAFDSAISLDPAFAPAYLHAVELGFNLGGAPLGLHYARAYLALSPTEASHRGVRLVDVFADPSRADSSRVAHLLDTVRTSALVSARTMLRRWPDAAETAVRLSRLLATGRPSEYALFSDTGFMRRRLAQELSFRGHLTEAYRVLGPRDVPIFAELALLNAVPRDSAHAVFARWLAAPSENCRLALGWWATQRDTSSLRTFADAASRRTHTGLSADERAMATYDTLAAMAHLALARGDSMTALTRLLALPDTLCPTCYVHRLTRARLLQARGRFRDAIATLDEPLVAFITPMEVVFALERARAAARTGDLTRSSADYAFVAQAWAHADPVLAPAVSEANAGASKRREH